MKLPIHLPFQKADRKEYYLSLLLSDEKVHATIFSENNGKIEVVGEKETHLHTPLEKLPEEELLDILDKTISSAESNLPENIQSNKTIFGVKEHWIEETKIKKEYLQTLKKVCDALGLTPIGFLVTHEAIAHLLQNMEGAPVSAILVELGTHELAVSILRAGKLLETKRVAVGESIVHTIDKTLLHFTNYEILPSRVILFNGTHTEKISQELISHQWSKTIPFLHVPQVKTLPPAFESRSLLFGAATQMGFEVVDKFDMPTIPTEGENFSLVAKANEESSPTNVADEKDPDETFGFVAEKDIAAHAPTHVEKFDVPQEHDSDETEESDEEEEDETIESYNGEFFASEHEEENHTRHRSSPVMQRFMQVFHSTLGKTKEFFATLPLPEVASRFPLLKKNKGLIFIPPVIVGLLFLFVLAYIFWIKATVVIHINPKTMEKTQAITFSTKQASDISANILAAEEISVSENGSTQTNATGKKEVGDKAKGTVTILSSQPKSQTISSGTTITSANGLVFTLDKDISLASSSGVSDIKSAQSSVTAKDIGKEYNLPSGTVFSVSGFDKSSIQGKNDNAFSGGSKEEITVIAKADIAKVTDALPKQLEDKAKGDLQGKLDSGKELLPVILSTSLDKKSYSKNVGDEASSVTLQGTVSFTSAAYTKAEVDKYALAVLSSENSGLAPDKNSTTFTLSDIADSNGDIGAKIAIKGFLLPKLEKEQITSQIAGKSFSEAKDLVNKLPQVQSTDITLHPSLPFLPALLPRISQNITIEVATNE